MMDKINDKDIKLPYGIKDGKLIHISQVESGLACGCVCPSCSSKLVARKGKKVAHHFAHYSGDLCPYATETALHLAAKEILRDNKRITLPVVNVSFMLNHKSIESEIAKSKVYEIDSVRVEKKVGNIIPDLILEIGQRKLLVEVFVTNRVNNDKLKKIKELGISAIEIDLSSAPIDMPMEVLSDLIINKVDNKKWLNNERVNEIYKNHMDKSIRKEVIRPGVILKVANCPRKIYIGAGKHGVHAHLSECFWCEFCVEIGPDNRKIDGMEYVDCVGHIPGAIKEHK